MGRPGGSNVIVITCGYAIINSFFSFSFLGFFFLCMSFLSRRIEF